MENLNYHKLTIQQYETLLELKDEDEIVSYLFKIPVSEIELMNVKEFNFYSKQLAFLKQPQLKRFNSLKWNGHEFAYKDVMRLTFGEYLDSVNYAKDDKIANLMAIFYRLFEPQKLDAPKLESYDFDISVRSQFFKKVPAIYYFQIKHDLERLDRVINENYSKLFNEEVQEETTEITDKRTEAQYIHEQKIKQSFSQHAWKYTAYALANNDVTKLDEIYAKPLFTILNILLLEKDLELRNKKKG